MRTQRVGKLDIDQPRLVKELEKIVHFEYSYAYSDYLCGGPWRSCMLWSSGGEAGNGFITSYDQRMPVAKTIYGRQLPYLCQIIERSFDLKLLTFARLAVISNSVIIPHKDLLELGRSLHRVHIPLITDDRCFFSEANVVYQMKFGEVWFFDAARTHSAASFSELERVHLMLDFEDAGTGDSLVNLNDYSEPGEIAADSTVAREDLTKAEAKALMSLASVIDIKNFRDVFSIVIKKHYSKDGGEEFIWNTVKKIARASGNPEVELKIQSLYEYLMIERSAAAN